MDQQQLVVFNEENLMGNFVEGMDNMEARIDIQLNLLSSAIANNGKRSLKCYISRVREFLKFAYRDDNQGLPMQECVNKYRNTELSKF